MNPKFLEMRFQILALQRNNALDAVANVGAELEVTKGDLLVAQQRIEMLEDLLEEHKIPVPKSIETSPGPV